MSSPKPKDKKLYEKTKEKAKKKFKVYPSIYANSWLVAEYKKAYEKKHGSTDAYEGDKPKDSGLPKWFDEEWIDLARSNPEKDKWVQCGRPKAGQKKSDWKKDYPKCLPKAKAKKLWKEGGKEAWDSAVKRKQAAVKKKSYKGGKPTYVSTKAAESETLKGENNGFFGMRKGLLAEAGIVGSSLFLVGAAMMQYERKGITDKRWWPYIATFFAGASLHLIYEALGLNKKYCETAFDADEVNKLDKEFKKLKPKYDTWRERVDWEGKNPKRPRKDDWKKDIEWEESVKLEADSESKHRIVLLGMPASGKGTQAPKVSERYGVPVLGMGATIRKNMEEQTELGMQSKAFMDAGELVPDELVIGMIDTELQDPKYRKGFVLDGYPRTVPQAERLERITDVDSVIFLTCTEDTVIGRIGGRRSCGGCGAVYHILFNPPKAEGTCDECGSELQRRADDTDEIIRNRIKVFWEKTAPLIDFYESRGLLKPVDANGTPNQVFENVVEALEGKEMVVMGAEEKPTSVEVKRSTNDEKKLMAVFKYPDGKTKTTHFGARGMSDYTKHGDKERMERYLDRHDNGREDWTDPTTAGALSRWILWNKPSLSGSFNDFKKRFKLKGDLKVKKSAESFESESSAFEELESALKKMVKKNEKIRIDYELNTEVESSSIGNCVMGYGVSIPDVISQLRFHYSQERGQTKPFSQLWRGKAHYYPQNEYEGRDARNFNMRQANEKSPVVEFVFPSWRGGNNILFFKPSTHLKSFGAELEPIFMKKPTIEKPKSIMSYDSEDTPNTLCNHQLVLGAEHYGDDRRPMTCPICINQLSSYQSFEADYIKSLRE